MRGYDFATKKNRRASFLSQLYSSYLALQVNRIYSGSTCPPSPPNPRGLKFQGSVEQKFHGEFGRDLGTLFVVHRPIVKEANMIYYGCAQRVQCAHAQWPAAVHAERFLCPLWMCTAYRIAADEYTCCF